MENGKWQLKTDGVKFWIEDDFYTICNVSKKDTVEEIKANALLISKSPEMLEMLNEQLNLIKSILRIKSLWLPKEPLSAEFSAEYISLSSMLNKLEEQEYQIKQLIKETTTI